MKAGVLIVVAGLDIFRVPWTVWRFSLTLPRNMAQLILVGVKKMSKVDHNFLNDFLSNMESDPEKYEYQNLLLNISVGLSLHNLQADEIKLLIKYDSTWLETLKKAGVVAS
jgi:hypothetical protein